MICTGFVFWYWSVLLVLVLFNLFPHTIFCTIVDIANPLADYTLPIVLLCPGMTNVLDCPETRTLMNLKTLKGRESGQIYLDEVLPF